MAKIKIWLQHAEKQLCNNTESNAWLSKVALYLKKSAFVSLTASHTLIIIHVQYLSYLFILPHTGPLLELGFM